MSIILRNVKGSSLTYNELDSNFIELSQSYATTGSNLFNGNQTINGNLIVLGTASFTSTTSSVTLLSASAFSILISSPTIRYGFYNVLDTGSLSTSSFAWDSTNKYWIYRNVTGSVTSSAILLTGPVSTGGLGTETSIPQYRIPTSNGNQSLISSNIYSSGSLHIVTGSLNVTGGITGSLSGSLLGTASFASTASFVRNAVSASYVLNAINALSASNAISSSFSTTASYVQQAESASYTDLGVTQVDQSGYQLTLTLQNGETVFTNIDSASFALSSSFASSTFQTVSSSFASTASYVLNAVSASQAASASLSRNSILLNSTASSVFATTGSNNFVGTQNINGNLNQGSGNSTTGIYSHAEGLNTSANGNYSHAEGSSTIANGSGSHAEGESTTADGYYSHAEGQGTIALGFYSHAEGVNTVASGAASHAEGDNTISSGFYSHAEGSLTVAWGSYSHAEGQGTIASGSAQTVMGKYNTQGNQTSLVVIGNGTDDSNRSDLVLFNEDSVVITGSLNISGSTSFIGTHILSGSNTITGNTVLSGSIIVSGSTTFRNTTFTVTGSQFYTGSSVFVGNQTITGSLSLQSNGIGTGLFINGQKQFNYISVFHTASILPTQNVSGSFIYSTVVTSSGISVTNNSRITFANTGIYNIQFSAQLFTSTGATVDIWFKKNGVNIANSGTKVGPTANNTYHVPAWNFVESVTSGSYIEIAYQTDQTNTQFQYLAATGNIPAIPSIIATVTQIA